MKETTEISTQGELSHYIHTNSHKFGITSYELLVLLSLALHMNKANSWVCFPSNKLIAQLSLCSERSVTAAIKSLSDKGIINNRKGGTHGNNRYNINVKTLSKLCGDEAVLTGCVLNVITGKYETFGDDVPQKKRGDLTIEDLDDDSENLPF